MNEGAFEGPPPTVTSVLLTGAPLADGAPDLSGLVVGGLAALARAAVLFDGLMVVIGHVSSRWSPARNVQSSTQRHW
jgi:hypothetical protein